MQQTAVKERPILFSGPMVQAILEGRKTQTRRVVKPQPPAHINDLHGGELSKRAPYDIEDEEQRIYGWGFQDDCGEYYRFPYGSVGDRLWAKEKARVESETTGLDAWHCIEYAAGGSKVERGTLPGKWFPSKSFNKDGSLRWQPSIHMPRWASRITLEITGVRVERLQDISEEDAIAEGVMFGTGKPNECRTCARGAFMDLWNKINGLNSWDANPWVWVIQFKRV